MGLLDLDAYLKGGATPPASPASAPPSATAPPPPPAPDLVGRLKSFLTKEPPEGAKSLFGETEVPGQIIRTLGDMFIPGSGPELTGTLATLPIGGGSVSGPLMRTAAGAVGAAAGAAMTGKDIGAAALNQAASQLVGETLFAPLRALVNQRTAKPLLDARESKIAQDRAMHDAITGAEQTQYQTDITARRAQEAARIREARARHQETVRDTKQQYRTDVDTQAQAHEQATTQATTTHAQSMRDWAQQGAATIADRFKEQVSAWSGIPSNEAGLLDMVYGRGQRLLSEAYDRALKQVVERGANEDVLVFARDAHKLGLEPRRFLDAKEGLEQAFVNAGQLADRVTGQWRKDPGLYRRIASALDQAGIGDPASRAEYRAGQALIQFADATNMLKGRQFNPDLAERGFTRLKVVDQLRRRDQGNIMEGPIAEAVTQGRPAPPALPPEPPPIPEPRMPVFRRPTPLPEVPSPPTRIAPGEPPMPAGLTVRQIPRIGFWEGAALAELPWLISGLVTGHHGYGGFGAPAALGGLAGRALSGRHIVTQAPLPPNVDAALRLGPTAYANYLRSLLSGPPSP